MSLATISLAMKLRDVSPVAKLVAIVLADYDGNCGGGPEIGHVMEFACSSEADVSAALDDLHEAGVLTYSIVDGCVEAVFPTSAEKPSDPVKKFINSSRCEIYVIAASTRTKIGISHSAQSRMETLQEWAPETLRLVRYELTRLQGWRRRQKYDCGQGGPKSNDSLPHTLFGPGRSSSRSRLASRGMDGRRRSRADAWGMVSFNELGLQGMRACEAEER